MLGVTKKCINKQINYLITTNYLICAHKNNIMNLIQRKNKKIDGSQNAHICFRPKSTFWFSLKEILKKVNKKNFGHHCPIIKKTKQNAFQLKVAETSESKLNYTP
jgi:hypothetical protein